MRARTLLLVSCLVAGTALIGRSYPNPKLIIPPSTIEFSHALHVEDMAVECLTCHEEAASSTASFDLLLPAMDVCGGCHDVEDDESCNTCHTDDEYAGYINPERTILFNHEQHRARSIDCSRCHGDIGSAEHSDEAEHMPTMSDCFECHDGTKADDACEMCHGAFLTLEDIHPQGWQRSHGNRAVIEPSWCMSCHRTDSFCLDCHRGDNVTGSIHDLNYAFTHGLDANSKERDCARCHERETFCVECHETGNRIPLLHSSLGWVGNHGRVAREDVENCAACHEPGDPTCGRVACHSDTDGLRGTDTPIHDPNPTLFEHEGAWHDDEAAFCFDCHFNTRAAGVGFCGYCHGEEQE